MSKLKEQILILRSDNKSYNEIAKILGCSKSIVGYYCNDITNSKQRKSTSLWRNTLKGELNLDYVLFVLESLMEVEESLIEHDVNV
jgi:predicted transcriptional regulator